MIDQPPDPLLERLRAADPAAGLDASARPARERVLAARRRRGARRLRRLAASGTVASLALALAFAAAPGGDRGTGGVLVRAVEASSLPPSSIVVIDSSLRLASSTTHVVQRSTTWMQTTPSGKLKATRWLVTGTDSPDFAPVDTEATSPGAHPGLLRSYDPRTERISVLKVGAVFPPAATFVVRVKRLLSAAQRDPSRVRLSRRRGAIRVESISVKPTGTSTREVWLDPQTYIPFRERRSERERDLHGRPVFLQTDLRVISRRTLPDTPENRRLLALRGPTD
jgi:hypothetical protein